MTVVFDTPGLIDLRSFTIGGLTAKPGTDNPIGRFGTGLKYAIAALVRLGADPVVWIGQDKYTFEKHGIEYRGKDVDVIRMKTEKWSWKGRFRYTEMPFTTEYGRHWEPWMFYRELEANTRDEQGMTGAELTSPGPTRTMIVVDHPDFDAAYEQRDTVFLPSSRRPIAEDSRLQQFEGESKYLYWRGMRVLELGKPSLYTWNFLMDMDLTEDRTIRSEFLARTYLAEWLTRQKNPDLILQMLTASEEVWESSMDFTWASQVTNEFRAIARSRPEGMLRSAVSWSDRHEPQAVPEDTLLLPWKIRENFVVDRNGDRIFQRPETMGDQGWYKMTLEMLEKMNG